MTARTEDRRIRAAVYRLTAETGRVPTAAAVAAAVGSDTAAVRAAYARLAAGHELGLTADGAEVRIANPFSATPVGYPVETAAGRYEANCAWDALGVCAILGVDGTTTATCPGSGTALTFGVTDGRLVGDADAVVHMVVPLARAWEDIGFT